MVLRMAVGLSLGIGVTLLAQGSPLLLKKKEPEKIQPPRIDETKILEGRLMQLESKIENLRDLRDSFVPPVQTTRPDIDVFELSQVLEANDLANTNRHKRELEEQRQALIREHLLKLEGEVLKVENKYRPTINKIKELETHLKTQNEVQQKEVPARLLWISCQALLVRMRYAPQIPLEQDPAYDVLKKFAANNNPLAINVIDSLPAKALKEGVQSEESLMDRFSKVEKICKRVALVDESGAGLSKYLVSYLQSLFIIDNVKVSEDEVLGRTLVDPTSWQTFDILARVRYCLAKRNLEQAVRYANQLKGQARVVARDWIRDARVYLETRQALSVLSTYAEATAVDSVRHTVAE